MAFNVIIPTRLKGIMSIPLEKGDILFAVGANGAGKSSLMQKIFTDNKRNAIHIIAHRQNWFSTNSIEWSKVSRESVFIQLKEESTTPRAIWTDGFQDTRFKLAIYDIIQRENAIGRNVLELIANSNEKLALEEARKPRPLEELNKLFRYSNIPIKLKLSDAEEILAKKETSDFYGITQLSDGEKNAFYIAATVLTAPKESLIIIDEPERHLHHSISSPLLSALFAERGDCAFVISTHDLGLPINNKNASLLFLRECEFNNQSKAIYWIADLLPKNAKIDDETKKEIVGARRRILFIEGNEESLDFSLYSIIFPDVTIVPKQGVNEVVRTVVSIRNSEDLHWINAFGIIDNDDRKSEDIENLKTKGIYALNVFSVESIYYHPEIQMRVAKRRVDALGGDLESLLKDAHNNTLATITHHTDELISKMTRISIREKLLLSKLEISDIDFKKPFVVNIDSPEIYMEHFLKLNQLLEQGNLQMIIEKYPVREVHVPSTIAKNLQFQSTNRYEEAVRKLLIDDADTLNFVKDMFGTLSTDLYS